MCLFPYLISLFIVLFTFYFFFSHFYFYVMLFICTFIHLFSFLAGMDLHTGGPALFRGAENQTSDDRSFSAGAPMLWNNPFKIRSAKFFVSFKTL